MILALVVPCYNEAEVLPTTTQYLLDILDNLITKQKISVNSYIYLVDDGSVDDTWSLIVKFSQDNPKIKGVKLSRNFGHQNALFCGLMQAKEQADCVISLDADLQDNHLVIEEFIDRYRAGYDIVYGVRQRRDTDAFFKRTSANIFYFLMRLLGTKLISNHADFRLTSKKILVQLSQFSEFNLFLRGLFPLVSANSTVVYYDRKKRLAGESKYSLRKMLAFSLDGITSLSIVPLRVISFLGILFFISSLLIGGYICYAALFAHETVPGWASTVLPIYLMGGIQLFGLGLIGEYLGKNYRESKARPRYIVETEISHEK